MQAWSTYYATIGAASATLIGLLFVAVSVNVSAALGSDDRLTRDMTEQAFQNYLVVMFVALLALFAQLETRTFGAICLSTITVRAIWLATRLGRTLRHRGPRQPLIFALRRHAAAVLGFGLLLYASARMTFGIGENFNALAAAILLLLLSATTVSWELLRRIANRASA